MDFICVYKITKKRGVLKKWLSGLCFKDADCVLFSGRCAILSSCHSSPFYVAGKTSRKQFFLFPKSQDLAKLSKINITIFLAIFISEIAGLNLHVTTLLWDIILKPSFLDFKMSNVVFDCVTLKRDWSRQLWQFFFSLNCI